MKTTADSVTIPSARGVICGLLLLLFGSMLLFGCSRPVEVRYVVMIEVFDRGKIRSGSRVWSAALSKSKLPLAAPYNTSFRGEAISVDIPGRGRLFGLVRSAELYPELAFGNVVRLGGDGSRYADRIDGLRQIRNMVGAQADLKCDSSGNGARCPLLVRFRDIRDPKTIEVVDPHHLERFFGAGISLKRISVRITDEPVTITNGSAWPSFGKATGYDVWYEKLDYADPRRITMTDFRRGW